MFNLSLIEDLSNLKSVIVHITQMSMHSLLGLMLTDEAHFVFGWMFFYPSIALTLLFVATQVIPVGTVDKCKKYCLKQARRIGHLVVRHRKFLLPARLLAGVAYQYFL